MQVYAWSRNLGGLISVLLFGIILVLLRVYSNNVVGVAEKYQKRQRHITITIVIRCAVRQFECVVFEDTFVAAARSLSLST